jgi:hypothetical protein
LFFNYGASLAVCSLVTVKISAFFKHKTLHVLLFRTRSTVFASYKIYLYGQIPHICYTVVLLQQTWKLQFSYCKNICEGVIP